MDAVSEGRIDSTITKVFHDFLVDRFAQMGL